MRLSIGIDLADVFGDEYPQQCDATTLPELQKWLEIKLEGLGEQEALIVYISKEST